MQRNLPLILRGGDRVESMSTKNQYAAVRAGSCGTVESRTALPPATSAQCTLEGDTCPEPIWGV